MAKPQHNPSANPPQQSGSAAQRKLHQIEELAESSNPKDPSPEIARDRQPMCDELHHHGAKRGPKPR